jgi:hypothetical protein
MEQRRLQLIAANDNESEGVAQVLEEMEHGGCEGEMVGICVETPGRENDIHVVGPSIGPSNRSWEATDVGYNR